MRNKKFVDLFCGVGGLTLGLSNAGFAPKIAVDIWEKAELNFKAYFPKVEFLKLDLSDNNYRDLLVSQIKKVNPVLIAGGPPCQGFSTLGKRHDEDKRNSLIDSYLDVLKRVCPLFIIIENVPGMKSMSHKSGTDYPTHIRKTLEGIGYQVATLSLNSVEFGIAQTRKRVFFLGMLHGVNQTGSPPFSELALQLSSEMKTKEQKTLRDAIYDLPRLTDGEGEESLLLDGEEILNHKIFKHSELLKKRLSFVPYAGGLQDIPRKYLSRHLRKMIDGEYGSGGFVKNLYGRLVWEKPSGTVVAGIRKVTCGRFVHPEDNRLLSVRECARLQGFPDDFRLSGSITEQYTLVGNAVPPVFGYVLGEIIKKLSKLRTIHAN